MNPAEFNASALADALSKGAVIGAFIGVVLVILIHSYINRSP